MKIQSVNNVYSNKGIKNLYLAENKKNNEYNGSGFQNVYYLPYNLSFGAISLRKTLAEPAPKVFREYVESKSKFPEFIKNKIISSDEMFKLLCFATSSRATKMRIASEMSEDPRKADEYKTLIIKKLGGDEKARDLFMTWLHDDKFGYRNAYKNYYNSEIWNKAENLDNIIKQAPFVAPWCFKSKAGDLGIEPTLGKLPKEFGTVKNFRSLISILKVHDSSLYQDIQTRLNEIDKLKNIDNKTRGHLVNQIVSGNIKTLKLNLNGETFIATPYKKSYSAKLIYDITSKENPDKSYMLKFIPYDNNFGGDYENKFYENNALRPDSPYLDAMIDFYLKYNNCPNALDSKFFDYQTQAYLYKKAEGKTPDFPEEYLDNLYNFQNYDKVSDIKKLGVLMNDTGTGNFIETKDGILKLIDSGHSYYSNVFRPQVQWISFSLGNLCGREVIGQV